MPDQTPEQDEQPPQWPPPQWHNEPTARPQTPYGEGPPPQVSTTDHGLADGVPSPRSPQDFTDHSPAPPYSTDDHSTGTPPGQQSFPAYDDTEPPPAPQFRSPSEDHGFHGFVPRQATEPTTSPAPHPGPPSPMPRPTAPEPPPAPEEPAESASTPPLTHGRGVRMTIYGIGGAIAIALIVAIVIMAGGSFVPDDDSAPEENPQEEVQGNPEDQLLTAAGDVDPAKYAQLAQAAGTQEWVDWRYGRTANPGEGERPTAEQPETTSLDLGDGIDHPYQIGDGNLTTGQQNQQGQLGFVANDGPGVDHITTTEATDSTIGYTPRPGGRYSTDSPELELTQRSTADCLGDHELGSVVAMARSAGSGTAAHAVIAFSSGAIATTGISGAQGGTCVILPEAHVPTAIAITPGNEFAFVTVWDTENISGKVAVIALADTPGTYAASWPSSYPGLPNPGHFGFAKLLGFVELSEMKAPTSVAVATDHSGADVDRRGADLADVNLRGNYSDVASSGFAVVSSGAERTVEWIDLTPLLSGFAAAYFDDDPSGYASPGGGADAWPPTFDSNAAFAPVPAGATKTDAHPMSVAASGSTGYVGFRDGTLAIFDASDPAAVGKAGDVDLPGAATCLTWSPDGKQLVATSRATQSISWVSVGSDEPAVDKILNDSRIIDPICAQDTLTSGSSSVRTIVIADFSGSLHSFRHGNATLASGDAFNLDNSFEYGGAYQPDGLPFLVSVTSDNVQ